LTSRRGRKFFDTNEFVPTRQKLAYLESRDDLCLRIEASDALSVEATTRVVQSCDLPLGGCFLMTVVIEDQLFIRQTEETFRKVYDSKVKALETFNRVKPIETLDFMVFFSSSVALVGNVGQVSYSV
jgi:KR domain